MTPQNNNEVSSASSSATPDQIAAQRRGLNRTRTTPSGGFPLGGNTASLISGANYLHNIAEEQEATTIAQRPFMERMMPLVSQSKASDGSFFRLLFSGEFNASFHQRSDEEKKCIMEGVAAIVEGETEVVKVRGWKDIFRKSGLALADTAAEMLKVQTKSVNAPVVFCILWNMEVDLESSYQYVLIWNLCHVEQVKAMHSSHRRELSRWTDDYLRDTLSRSEPIEDDGRKVVKPKFVHELEKPTVPKYTNEMQISDIFNAATGGTSGSGANGEQITEDNSNLVFDKSKESVAVGIARIKKHEVFGNQIVQMLTAKTLPVFPVKLSPEEEKAAKLQDSLIVTGRAGSGKTLVLEQKAFDHILTHSRMNKDKSSGSEQASTSSKRKANNDQQSPLVLFVTLSPVLALNVKKHFEGMLQTAKMTVSGGGENALQAFEKKVQEKEKEAQDRIPVSSGLAELETGIQNRGKDDEELEARRAEAAVGIGFAPLTKQEREDELRKQPKSFAAIPDDVHHVFFSYPQLLQVVDNSVDDDPKHRFFKNPDASSKSSKVLGFDPDAEVTYRRFKKHYYDADMKIKLNVKGVAALHGPLELYKEIRIIKDRAQDQATFGSPCDSTPEDEDAEGLAQTVSFTFGAQVRDTMRKPIAKKHTFEGAGMKNKKKFDARQKERYGRRHHNDNLETHERQKAGEDDFEHIEEEKDVVDKFETIVQPYAKNEYVDNPPPDSLLFGDKQKEDRKKMWNAFEAYEKLKKSNNEWDMSDAVKNIFERVRKCGLTGNRRATLVLSDESQDLSIAQLLLLGTLCKNPFGFAFAHDPAQCIADGRVFRNERLKGMWRNYYMDPQFGLCDENDGAMRKKMPTELRLRRNFRCPQNIVTISQVLIELIGTFVNKQIDTTEPEECFEAGEVPSFVTGMSDLEFKDALFKSEEKDNDGNVTKPIAFGADQVIIVATEDDKKEVKQLFNELIVVLTTVEAKGLEFNDEIIWAPFSRDDGAREEKSWGLIFDYLKQVNPKRNQEVAELETKFASTERTATDLWVTRLKELIVCVTRTKTRLIVFAPNKLTSSASNSKADKGINMGLSANAFLKLFHDAPKRGLSISKIENSHAQKKSALEKEPFIALVDGVEAAGSCEAIYNFPRQSSKEDYLKRGQAYFEECLYREAEQMYRIAGRQCLADWAKVAFTQDEAKDFGRGENLSEKIRKKQQEKYLEAARLSYSISEKVQAKGALPEDVRIAPRALKQAGELFAFAGDMSEAAKAYEKLAPLDLREITSNDPRERTREFWLRRAAECFVEAAHKLRDQTSIRYLRIPKYLDAGRNFWEIKEYDSALRTFRDGHLYTEALEYADKLPLNLKQTLRLENAQNIADGVHEKVWNEKHGVSNDNDKDETSRLTKADVRRIVIKCAAVVKQLGSQNDFTEFLVDYLEDDEDIGSEEFLVDFGDFKGAADAAERRGDLVKALEYCEKAGDRKMQVRLMRLQLVSLLNDADLGAQFMKKNYLMVSSEICRKAAQLHECAVQYRDLTPYAFSDVQIFKTLCVEASTDNTITNTEDKPLNFYFLEECCTKLRTMNSMKIAPLSLFRIIVLLGKSLSGVLTLSRLPRKRSSNIPTSSGEKSTEAAGEVYRFLKSVLHGMLYKYGVKKRGEKAKSLAKFSGEVEPLIKFLDPYMDPDNVDPVDNCSEVLEHDFFKSDHTHGSVRVNYNLGRDTRSRPIVFSGVEGEQEFHELARNDYIRCVTTSYHILLQVCQALELRLPSQCPVEVVSGRACTEENCKFQHTLNTSKKNASSNSKTDPSGMKQDSKSSSAIANSNQLIARRFSPDPQKEKLASRCTDLTGSVTNREITMDMYVLSTILREKIAHPDFETALAAEKGSTNIMSSQDEISQVVKKVVADLQRNFDPVAHIAELQAVELPKKLKAEHFEQLARSRAKYFRDKLVNPTLADLATWAGYLTKCDFPDDAGRDIASFGPHGKIKKIWKDDTFVFVSWFRSGVKWQHAATITGTYCRESKDAYFNMTDTSVTIEYIEPRQGPGHWLWKKNNQILLRNNKRKTEEHQLVPNKDWIDAAAQAGKKGKAKGSKDNKPDADFNSDLKLNSDKTPFSMFQSIASEIMARSVAKSDPNDITYDNHISKIADWSIRSVREFKGLIDHKNDLHLIVNHNSPVGIMHYLERASLWCLLTLSHVTKLPVCRSLWLRHFEGAENLLVPLFWELPKRNDQDKEQDRKKVEVKLMILIDTFFDLASCSGRILYDYDEKKEDGDAPLLKLWCDRWAKNSNGSALEQYVQLNLRFWTMFALLGYDEKSRFVMAEKFKRTFRTDTQKSLLRQSAKYLPQALAEVVMNWPHDAKKKSADRQFADVWNVNQVLPNLQRALTQPSIGDAIIILDRNDAEQAKVAGNMRIPWLFREFLPGKNSSESFQVPKKIVLWDDRREKTIKFSRAEDQAKEMIDEPGKQWAYDSKAKKDSESKDDKSKKTSSKESAWSWGKQAGLASLFSGSSAEQSSSSTGADAENREEVKKRDSVNSVDIIDPENDDIFNTKDVEEQAVPMIPKVLTDEERQQKCQEKLRKIKENPKTGIFLTLWLWKFQKLRKSIQQKLDIKYREKEKEMIRKTREHYMKAAQALGADIGAYEEEVERERAAACQEKLVAARAEKQTGDAQTGWQLLDHNSDDETDANGKTSTANTDAKTNLQLASTVVGSGDKPQELSSRQEGANRIIAILHYSLVMNAGRFPFTQIDPAYGKEFVGRLIQRTLKALQGLADEKLRRHPFCSRTGSKIKEILRYSKLLDWQPNIMEMRMLNETVRFYGTKPSDASTLKQIFTKRYATFRSVLEMLDECVKNPQFYSRGQAKHVWTDKRSNLDLRLYDLLKVRLAKCRKAVIVHGNSGNAKFDMLRADKEITQVIQDVTQLLEFKLDDVKGVLGLIEAIPVAVAAPAAQFAGQKDPQAGSVQQQAQLPQNYQEDQQSFYTNIGDSAQISERQHMSSSFDAKMIAAQPQAAIDSSQGVQLHQSEYRQHMTNPLPTVVENTYLHQNQQHSVQSAKQSVSVGGYHNGHTSSTIWNRQDSDAFRDGNSQYGKNGLQYQQASYQNDRPYNENFQNNANYSNSPQRNNYYGRNKNQYRRGQYREGNYGRTNYNNNSANNALNSYRRGQDYGVDPNSTNAQGYNQSSGGGNSYSRRNYGYNSAANSGNNYRGPQQRYYETISHNRAQQHQPQQQRQQNLPQQARQQIQIPPRMDAPDVRQQNVVNQIGQSQQQQQNQAQFQQHEFVHNPQLQQFDQNQQQPFEQRPVQQFQPVQGNQMQLPQQFPPMQQQQQRNYDMQQQSVPQQNLQQDVNQHIQQLQNHLHMQENQMYHQNQQQLLYQPHDAPPGLPQPPQLPPPPQPPQLPQTLPPVIEERQYN